MTLTQPPAHDAVRSRRPWAGVAALMLAALLVPSMGNVLVPFGLALAITPLRRTPNPAQRDATRSLAHDLVMIALFGSVAAAAAVLWPGVGRDPAGIGQLLSELYHRGPELWGSARAKSPPEIINTIQGCVQPDRISHLPMSASGTLGQRHSSLMARSFAVLMEVSAARDSVVAVGRRLARRGLCEAVRVVTPLLQAHGRSPPLGWGAPAPRLALASYSHP